MTVPIGMAAAGVGLQAFSQYQAGEEEAAAAKYNEQVKLREADAERQKTIVESRRQAEEANRRMEAMKLNIPGVQTATTANLIREQARQNELENLMIGYEGTTTAGRLTEEGRIIARRGKSAKAAARIGAGATLLTGFGKVFA